MTKEITDKKQRVLDTALHMILENGIQSASMGKISKTSGVAVGTIYHHFASKEKLITELYRTLKLKLLKTFQELEYSESVKDTFRIILKSFMKYAMDYPDEFEFIERYHMSPIIDLEVRKELEAQFMEENEAYINYFRSNTGLKEIPDELIFLFIMGSINSVIRAHISGDNILEDEYLDVYIDMIWDGLTK